MTGVEITIRRLYTPEEMAAAVDLQKVYWGENMGDLVPSHMLTSITNYGGHLHGAFVGDKMVGMLLGFLGADIKCENHQNAPERMLIMSKRMVVLPQYRGHKIGENLKLAQAKYARQHGIQLVTWTFDPLLSRNAYLNLHKLGAVGQKYFEDYFGMASADSVLGADRLVMNWWVRHPHVKNHPELDLSNTPVANVVSLSPNGLLVPQEFRLPKHAIIRLEIPIEFQPIINIDSDLAQRWRDHVRLSFQHLLEARFIATDFTRLENRVFYVFTHDDGTFDFT
ncbi:MAG: GNAT family N-acetyltransferase [Anaerolineae bacterium]|nr:GNAT family N-acetyltransferase [Anaerolineae bacterium]